MTRYSVIETSPVEGVRRFSVFDQERSEIVEGTTGSTEYATAECAELNAATRPLPLPTTPQSVPWVLAAWHIGRVVDKDSGRPIATFHTVNEAEFAVKAVNVHAELVAALRACYDALPLIGREIDPEAYRAVQQVGGIAWELTVKALERVDA